MSRTAALQLCCDVTIIESFIVIYVYFMHRTKMLLRQFKDISVTYSNYLALLQVGRHYFQSEIFAKQKSNHMSSPSVC